ncbi:methionine biosynthesis protein MetW [Spiribacter halobius]|uniref:methionine biosynthesis protein MetW n=1 Tax=Sediminicurvatus halobius TaxID=2182432 RepID=UPI0026A87E4C
MTGLRRDLQIVADWIGSGSRVLDLGCGDGHLLRHLYESRNVTGYGLEIDPEQISESVANGVNVIQTDLDQGLSDFEAEAFDHVVMTQTLQAVQRPDRLLLEMLRVGREGIVTFPNFAYWRLRYYLAILGRMPMSGALAYAWYETPNIHLCTIHDFEELCRELGIRIIERRVLSHELKPPRLGGLLPNLLAEVALYRFRRA